VRWEGDCRASLCDARNDSRDCRAVLRTARNDKRDNMGQGKHYYVYIMTNKNNTVLYTGVTGNLKGRVYEHKEKFREGFTKRYNVTKLVYFEKFRHIESAIRREKQIKAGSRRKKEELINSLNKEWDDLCERFEIATSLRSSQ